MKSKTSFFNKGIFWKNVTLYWPIWVIYTIILLIFLPGMLWMGSNSWGYSEKLTEAQMLNILGSMPMPFYVAIIAGMALITGFALFSYLFNARTANMIHSLPVDRNQLFGTNVISGLAFLILPQILTFAVSVLYCLNRGIAHLEYLVMWLFMSAVTAFVAYSIVTFCSFLTGQIVTMVCFVVLINVFSFGISALISLVYEIFAFGSSGIIVPEDIIFWCSPYAALTCLEIYPLYENEVYVGMGVSGKDIMLVYFIIALVLYAAAWLLYKKRHIEHAGDLLTVAFLKPVFRWGVGFCGALTGAPIIYDMFLEIGKVIPMFLFVLLFVLIGMICYWIADMLIKKTFKVFQKKYIVQWGIFSTFLVVGFSAIYLSTNVYETKIPDKEDVAYAFVDYNYTNRFEKEELDKVFAVHEAIIENKDRFEETLHKEIDSGQMGDWIYVAIQYYAEDNSIIMCREYHIPYNEEGIPILQKMSEYEQEPEKFLNYVFNNQYKDVTTFGSGNLEYPIEYKEDIDEIVYENVEFDSNAAKVLYKAVIADAYAGTLYPHNVFASNDKDSQLVIFYKLPESENVQINQSPNSISGLVVEYEEVYENYGYVESISEPWGNAWIDFGRDCTNIVNALVELGLIASADEIP